MNHMNKSVKPSRFILLVFTACLQANAEPKGIGNDRMYPPAPAARSAINVDGQGFFINGRRTYIASGSLHYARVPHELWRDRLLRIKRAGFNTVETYAFWNFHEPRENEWNFTGDRDLGVFLSTAQELGLYAIVRVGPYVCAEWDSGGYPLWLRFKPPFKVRTADPGFLAVNDHWYDKILPLVAAHQIHRGGNVIMVQLENEHPNGKGTMDGDPYFDHLRQKALALGVEVPFFFSGLNHGRAPTPGKLGPRETPWFTTESWCGWFDLYGVIDARKFQSVERANWEIIEQGGGGHNFYMLHGGSNFETWNDPSGGASYDYGAAIGQAGDLRPIYYAMKRANQFAQVWPALRDAGATATFDNNGASTVKNAPLADGLQLVECSARLLGIARHDQTITLVVFGSAGETGRLKFTDRELTVTFPIDLPTEQSFVAAGNTVRVVAMNPELADRTWIIGNDVVCGPSYVGDYSETGLTIERPYGKPSCGKVIVYGTQVRQFTVKSDSGIDSIPAPKLEGWQMRLAPEAEPEFNDANWKSSDKPLPMGADGDTSAFAWYRATINVPSAGADKLTVGRSADNALVFVNGKRSLEFHVGRNVIAVFVSHHGRPKALNYTGPLDTYLPKGLLGSAQLEIGGKRTEVNDWKMRGGVGTLDGAWQPLKESAGRPAFYRATFITRPSAGRIFRATNQGLTRGTMWLNGHNLGRYPEKIKVNGLYLPECWLNDGANTLVVFDEEGAAPATVTLEVETAASREVIPLSRAAGK